MTKRDYIKKMNMFRENKQMVDNIYRVPKSIETISEILDVIPKNTTILDATDCKNLRGLNGIQRLPILEQILLKGSAITSESLRNLPDTVRFIDCTDCNKISSYEVLKYRAKNPLVIRLNTKRETVLRKIPAHLIIENDAYLTFGVVSHSGPLSQDKIQNLLSKNKALFRTA